MSDLIRLRRGTTAEWASANPILRSGEPGVDLDTGEFKIGDGVTQWSGLGVINGSNSFESVSKNLSASDATLTYSSGNLIEIEYANGITKTLNYTGDNLTSVVLSGSTPGGIELTKTLSYTGSDLTGVAYS